MSRAQRIIFTSLSRALLALYLIVRVTLDMIGYTQAPANFADLPEALRTIFNLWVAIPSWINWALFILLLTLVFLTHLPDMSAAGEIKEHRKQAKEANDKAWAFSGTHHEMLENVKKIELQLHAVSQSVERLDEHVFSQAAIEQQQLASKTHRRVDEIAQSIESLAKQVREINSEFECQRSFLTEELGREINSLRQELHQAIDDKIGRD